MVGSCPIGGDIAYYYLAEESLISSLCPLYLVLLPMRSGLKAAPRLAKGALGALYVVLMSLGLLPVPLVNLLAS
jgi:hypothetical protein